MTALTVEYARLLKAENRRKKTRKVVARIIRNQIIGAIAALVNGWMLMLAIGVAHTDWAHQVPTIGYWWAVLIVWLLKGVFSRIEYPKDEGK